MINIFITGANSLLGTNLIELLCQRNYNVYALVRSKSKYHGKQYNNLFLIESNLFDDLSQYLKKCTILVHIAAETRQHLHSARHYDKINFYATKSIFETAQQCHVKRMIMISTANTLSHGTKDNPGNELKPFRYPFTKSFYAQSKSKAEQYLKTNSKETEVIFLHPTFMLGGYDHKPSSGKILFMIWKKKWIFCPKGGKNFVHVQDVSKAIISAFSKAKDKEHYLLCNENLTYKEFFKKFNHTTQQKTKIITVPDFILLCIGFFGDLVRLLQINTSLNSTNMRILYEKNFYSNQKSRSELGIEYQPVETAIRDALHYFNQKGM